MEDFYHQKNKAREFFCQCAILTEELASLVLSPD